MKTTVELPEDVLRQLERRAVREGRRVAELVVELVRAGLKQSAKKNSPKIGRKLPIVDCDPARPEEEMTPDRVAEVLWGTSH
ncbi:MAG TPA: hypothetical protein PLV70_08435 [Flavobacteriales bacterium]|nr:hypothetical protein [Flavobacteriales bacterium]HRO40444.1 hypothetical protein [Flavobacteriales bacterium]HRP82087.1 hypothetical protein [Flavobacteriales bacterium]HRQ85122.1 hypothetical protein [Flavobacteriales bacterium]